MKNGPGGLASTGTLTTSHPDLLAGNRVTVSGARRFPGGGVGNQPTPKPKGHRAKKEKTNQFPCSGGGLSEQSQSPPLQKVSLHESWHSQGSNFFPALWARGGGACETSNRPNQHDAGKRRQLPASQGVANSRGGGRRGSPCSVGSYIKSPDTYSAHVRTHPQSARVPRPLSDTWIPHTQDALASHKTIDDFKFLGMTVSRGHKATGV